MKGMMGTKVAMTQVFDSNGIMIPVTVIKAVPNLVLNVKTKEKDGYDSVQIAFGTTKVKNATKARAGTFKKFNSEPLKEIREIRDMKDVNSGDKVDASMFKIGEIVDVEGVTKGHGFTGAIERWNMKIGPMSHGAGYPHRYQGSLGGGRGGSSAQHVFKGKKMSGNYGTDNVTIENLQIVDIDQENQLVLIKGSVPGPKGSIVTILKAEKNPEKIQKVKLSDLLLEGKKNKFYEEAKQFGAQLNPEMTLKQMEEAIASAKQTKETADAATAAPVAKEGENK